MADTPELTAATRRVSRRISIDSTPEGAEIRHRKYGTTGTWRLLGSTPVRDAAIPLGLREWQISKDGFATIHDVGLPATYFTIANKAPRVPHAFLLDPPDRVPAGMVHASPRGPQLLSIAGLEHVPAFELADYWIDRHEVTNREYKAFVDADGYAGTRPARRAATRWAGEGTIRRTSSTIPTRGRRGTARPHSASGR